MGLSTDMLSPGEEIVLEMHEHWKHLLGTAAVCLAAVVGLAVLLAIGPDDGFFRWLDRVAWLAFLVVIGIFGAVPVIAWWRRSYTLTTQRLATRTGVLRRVGRDIPLTRINDVAFEQGVLDRVVGAGTLRVSAASEEGTIVLKDVPDVQQVSLRLHELVRAVGDRQRAG
jgi:membrane protein YdbS with pleckstrin-like domain